MTEAYYNENDPHAAAWLRELIAARAIPAGDVDERSICDVQPRDLRGYVQHHFFCGIGGWPLALRLAGWPEDEPCWTGSCPCQGFSTAGAGAGFDDPRHLWPAWFRLIRELRPATVFGEQVEAAVGFGWLDLVFGDLEGEGYACGAAVLGACSVGAPHIRKRLYWVADHAEPGRSRRWPSAALRGAVEPGRRGAVGGVAEPASARYDDAGQHRGGSPSLPARSEQCGDPRGVADAEHSERRSSDAAREYGDGQDAGRPQGAGVLGERGDAGRMADADGWDALAERQQRGGEQRQQSQDHGALGRVGSAAGRGCGIVGDAALSGRGGCADGANEPGILGNAGQSGLEKRGSDCGVQREAMGAIAGEAAECGGDAINPWSDAVWIPCRDGKLRAIQGEAQSFTEPMADGISDSLGRCSVGGVEVYAPLIEKGEGRTMRLRGYGNAIVPALAAEFIRAFMEAKP